MTFRKMARGIALIAVPFAVSATLRAQSLPTGRIAVGTSYLGAAQPGGAKWWNGWTAYARN